MEKGFELLIYCPMIAFQPRNTVPNCHPTIAQQPDNFHDQPWKYPFKTNTIPNSSIPIKTSVQDYPPTLVFQQYSTIIIPFQSFLQQLFPNNLFIFFRSGPGFNNRFSSHRDKKQRGQGHHVKHTT